MNSSSIPFSFSHSHSTFKKLSKHTKETDTINDTLSRILYECVYTNIFLVNFTVSFASLHSLAHAFNLSHKYAMVSERKTFFNLVSTPRIQLFYEHFEIFERKMLVCVCLCVCLSVEMCVTSKNEGKIKRLTIDRNRPQNIWFQNRFLCVHFAAMNVYDWMMKNEWKYFVVVVMMLLHIIDWHTTISKKRK